MDQWRPAPRRTLADGVEQIRKWQEYFGWRRIVGSVLGVVAVLIGVTWLLSAPNPPIEQKLPFATTPTTIATPDYLVVHVVGAVHNPGVYKVTDGSRLFEVVYLAGGFRPDADQAGVNLAAVVSDGEQIYVPIVGEQSPALSPRFNAERAGKININRASVDEIETLPGIGPTTAAAIVAYRETNGAFSAIEDLLRVTGIGDAKLAAIRELISL